ncbi:polymorphic toxin type 44 domain-containing protein [Siccibacter turicensis]|uniref:polymorphic toxin type 44 domain-containing protein n=1 Tax=Siccibacter turicensis TaxID=357233 RepID=UPI0021598391|nr:polymorphic toxin type 44 domain-containing protein [Siccibacter turicensis]
MPEEILLRAAGWAQLRAGTSEPAYGEWYNVSPYGDDPTDQGWIRMGINYAKRTGF